jgi:hypothetical protein
MQYEFHSELVASIEKTPRLLYSRQSAARGWNYEQSRKFGSHAGQLGTGDGVQQNTE